jgi:hypothetical protein
MRENTLIVASLPRRDVTADSVTCLFPTLASSKGLKLLPGNKRGEAMRREEVFVHGSVRLGSAQYCLARHGVNTTSLLSRNRGSVFRCYRSCMA